MLFITDSDDKLLDSDWILGTILNFNKETIAVNTTHISRLFILVGPVLSFGGVFQCSNIPNPSIAKKLLKDTSKNSGW